MELSVMELPGATAGETIGYVGTTHHFGWWLLWQMLEKSGGVRAKAAREANVDPKTMRDVYEMAEPRFRSTEIPIRIARYLGISVQDLQTRWQSEAVDQPPEERRGAHLRREAVDEPAGVKYDELGRNWQKVLEEAKRFGLTPEQVRDAIRRTRPPDQTQGS
jgi:hypothetical protein